jgi:Lar family restriction alleviation protein
MGESRKSCPFCGGTSLTTRPWFTGVHRSADVGLLYAVVCLACGAMGPRAASAEEAEAKWNERRSELKSLYFVCPDGLGSDPPVRAQ